MEVVPGIGAVVARAGLAGVDGEDCFCERLVSERGFLLNGEIPSGCTWSRLDHSNRSLPVAMSSSIVELEQTETRLLAVGANLE